MSHGGVDGRSVQRDFGADLLSVANAVFRNERNMANEQAKVTKQKLVQLMCEA